MTIQRYVTVAKSIYTRGLDAELRAAGIPLEGIGYNSTEGWVRVDFTDAATEQQQGAATDAVIAAHAGINTDQQALNDVRARWIASAIHGKTPTEIYSAVQGAIDGWGSLAQAKADLRVWLPLVIAALAWETMRDEQR